MNKQEAEGISVGVFGMNTLHKEQVNIEKAYCVSKVFFNSSTAHNTETSPLSNIWVDRISYRTTLASI